MLATKGYYSLIQYCPDPARLEFANVGVLLFCPDIGFIESRLSSNNDRVRRFFSKDYPHLDLIRLKVAKQSIENRINLEKNSFQSLDILKNFINTRANELRLTDPRPIKVHNPSEVLENLFLELVDTRSSHLLTIYKETSPLFPKLDSTFQSLHRKIPGRIHLGQYISVPVYEKKLEVNYGYHNGSLNWVRTQLFKGTDQHINQTASVLALQGRFIEKHSIEENNNEQKLIVVSCIPDRIDEIEPRIKDIFNEVGQHLITQDQVDIFADQIESEAH